MEFCIKGRRKMRLELKRFGSTEKTAERLYGDMARRLTAGSNGKIGRAHV